MRRLLSDRTAWAAFALLALYVVVFSAIGIRQHDAFLTHKEDLGQIDQAVWNSLHGRLLVETDEDHQSTRLTDHAEPSLVLSSLVFLLWDDVRALLIWQAVAAALGGWAIFWLARDILKKDWLAVLFVLFYLLFPALEAAQLVEFHAAPLAVAPVAFSFLFLRRRQWGRYIIACLLIAAVKEEMALLAATFGMAGLFIAIIDTRNSHPERNAVESKEATRRPPPATRHISLAIPGLLPSAFILLTSVAWFMLTTFVIIPHFGAAKYGTGDSVYFQRFGVLGDTPAAVVRTLLTNPALVAKVISEPARLGYLGGLLASVGFLALASPWALLIGSPLLAVNLLSSFQAQYSGDFHYSAPLAPIFVVAAIYGWGKTRSWVRGQWVRGAVLAAICGVVLIYHVERGYSPLSQNFYWPDITPHAQLFARFAAQIPADARVSATPPLFPHLSHREFIYDFPVISDSEYIMLDASGVTDMHPNDFRSKVNALLGGGQYGVSDSADGYILLKRGVSATSLPNAFYDFARAPNPQPQVRMDITFGDAVRLIGYDMVPDSRWHLVQVRTYWQALRPLDEDLHVFPFYHDAEGKVIEDTTARPMLATVWYPPSRWQVGETIQPVTLPWDVGDSFMLAAGVLHGSDWDRKGQRLTTPTGETQVELGTYTWQGKILVRK